MLQGMVRFLLGLSLLMGAFASTALADDGYPRMTFSLLGGGYVFDGGQGLEDSSGFAVALDYRFHPRWSLEGTASRVDATFEERAVDALLTSFRLDLMRHFRPGQAFVPYLAVGGGVSKLDFQPGDYDRSGLVDYGFGFQWFLTHHLGLRFDARHLLDVNRSDRDRSHDVVNNFSALAGVVLRFGAAPQAKPKRADHDGDGVVDVEDRCPETPAGTLVTVLGCPHDTDLDGVYDDLDQCPETPRGTLVDPDGCAVDSDGDGVSDGFDRCPETAVGAVVTAFGCPQDTDGDGVEDAADRCPETPRGRLVDQTGCAVDSDGDGVSDGLDRCPDTAAGMTVDAMGCTPPVQGQKPVRTPLEVELRFPLASKKLDADANSSLQQVADFLNADPQRRVLIEGHTDSIGPAAANLIFSQQRAARVKAELVNTFGIDPARLEVKGYGETRPIADNSTQEGRQQNRRVRVVSVED